MNSKISLIIPVFNLEAYIDRCICSLLSQTYENLEFIFVDDGSKDNSLSILRMYEKEDKRVKVIKQENSGVSVARNRGIEVSTGDYIMFVDGDDWLEFNAVEKMFEYINSGDHDIACCNFVFECLETGEKRYTSRPFISYELKGRDILASYLSGKGLWASSCARLYKVSFLKTYCFQFEPGVSIGEDGFFSLQVMSKAKSIIICGDPFYHVLVRSSSATRSVACNGFLFRENSYCNYLYNNGLLEDFIEEYRVWFLWSCTSCILKATLRLSYANFKTSYDSYVIDSNFYQFNKHSIRKRMSLKKYLLALLSKYPQLAYSIFYIYTKMYKKYLF